ncbi:endonuclease/exonuclease/phosphatase family protein [Bacteroides sp. UBA939]|uniref:endonuclease/exonuclease/phosphatase family protein n=1 Tax=Bacteroides sp. UBA939 TaxID=1946092 RepID=UPI0025C1C2A7|nr:endonuclease/exonuclease/phosphatase family protein [Bacteroides sp. UBA939]
MKKQLLIVLNFLPVLLFAQQEVRFPDDFRTSALNGKEVTITNTLTLTSNRNYNTGSITLSKGQLWTPTEKNQPGIEMFNQENQANQENQLTVRQGTFSFTDANSTCRIGQTVEGLTGNASYRNGTYTITLTRKPEFKGNERPTSCNITKQYNLKVASFNLEHLNKSIDTYSIKLSKVALALQALQADIYALVEVEGAAGLNELCQLLNENYKLLNGNSDTQKYQTRYYRDNAQGMACFIYDSETVTPIGAISPNTLADNYLPNRKTAQGFQLNSNKERFILCCNHWKAKVGSNIPNQYKDKGDGQGAYNLRRVQEAEATLQFIEEIKKTYNDPDVLVVGDLNAYTCEDPIRTLEDGGLVNLLTTYAPNEYSYAFFSNSSYAIGYLDHSLATSTLEQQAVDARPFRINADEPQRMDIDQSGAQPGNMYRCSDHNPIVTFINLGTGTTGIKDIPAYSRPTIRLTGNPRSAYLTLVSNTSSPITRIEILNISGQSIATHNMVDSAGIAESSFTFPITGLTRGFYLIRAYDEQGECTTCKTVIP